MKQDLIFDVCITKGAENFKNTAKLPLKKLTGG
jgi:hypothetical protein